MRASSRLTCIQRFDPPRASLLLSLSLYSLYLSPPPHLSWSLPPLPQRQPEIKTGFHFPLHSSLVSFFFLPSSSSSSFFFLSSHFFLFLDHYNTVRRIPVPAWLNPIIYSFLRVVAHKWVVLGLVLLYNRMRRVRLSIRPGRINEKVNERFRIATRYPFSVFLYLSSFQFVAFVSLGFVQFVALCFKRPFTSSFFSFHDYYDPGNPIIFRSIRSRFSFFAPTWSTLDYYASWNRVRRIEKLRSFLVVSRSKSRARSLIPCTVNNIDSLLQVSPRLGCN